MHTETLGLHLFGSLQILVLLEWTGGEVVKMGAHYGNISCMREAGGGFDSGKRDSMLEMQ